MELSRIKSAYTAEERELALRKARSVSNPVLIELALEVTHGKKSFENYMYSAAQKKFALKKALTVKKSSVNRIGTEGNR